MKRSPEGDRPSAVVIGCGFIGRRVFRRLSDDGHRVRVLSRHAPPPEVRARARDEVIVGDAMCAEVVRRAIAGVDEVVYCAGGLVPASAEHLPELDADLTLGPLRVVLEELRAAGGASLAYFSSGGTVYGDPTRIPVAETEPLRPISVYGKVRVAAEALVRDACRSGEISARVLRCANVYGPHQPVDRGQGAVGVFLHRVARGEPIAIYGDGLNKRDYVHVDDVSDALAALLRRPAPDGVEVLNVGSGEGTTTLDVLSLVERTVGRTAELVQAPARGFDVRELVLDLAELRSRVPFAPVALEEGVRLTAAAELRSGPVAVAG